MEHLFLQPFSRLAVCGGTHGNELSGVYAVKELRKTQPDQFGSFSVAAVISNPRAVEACRRYMETDLNRCFTEALLSAPVTDATPYEVRRAHELNSQLGPKGSRDAMDLVCDLHNTTANMGICIICLNSDWAGLHLYKYIQERTTATPVRLILLDLAPSEVYSLESLGKHGLSIEVGPQPHGVIRADIYNWMKEALDRTLDWVQSFNSGATFEGGEVEVYIHERSVDYPRDPETQEITAAIHPQLQDSDFTLLRPGDPIFQTFSGETILYAGKELYPYFVNECAYYEKKIAFHLGRKVTMNIPSISVKKN